MLTVRLKRNILKRGGGHQQQNHVEQQQHIHAKQNHKITYNQSQGLAVMGGITNSHVLDG